MTVDYNSKAYLDKVDAWWVQPTTFQLLKCT